MEVSARNSLKGTIKEIHPGAVNSEVILEIVPGVQVTAIITKESVGSYSFSPSKKGLRSNRNRRMFYTPTSLSKNLSNVTPRVNFS